MQFRPLVPPVCEQKIVEAKQLADKKRKEEAARRQRDDLHRAHDRVKEWSPRSKLLTILRDAKREPIHTHAYFTELVKRLGELEHVLNARGYLDKKVAPKLKGEDHHPECYEIATELLFTASGKPGECRDKLIEITTTREPKFLLTIGWWLTKRLVELYAPDTMPPREQPTAIKDYIEKWPFGMTANFRAFTVTRNGITVDFGGKQIIWGMMEKLANNYENPTPKEALCSPTAGLAVVPVHMTELRDKLKPLGIYIPRATSNVGYKLSKAISEH